jgi:hypothetical protein
MKISFLILILFSLLTNNTFSQSKDTSMNAKINFDFTKLISLAIQEDVKSIIEILNTLPSSGLSLKESDLKDKYYKRFVSNDEQFDYNTDDQLLIGLIDIYKDYWKSILLKEQSIENADSLLKENLFIYIKKNYPPEISEWNETEVESDPWLYLSKLLSMKNYFNNVNGKTGNLYDIYIWRREDTVDYNVELPEVNINVPVIFMNDIVTMGWEEYATLGRAYPGGWPKDGALFCVSKAYDTTKESFLVSYLAHESQHFSDMKTYKEFPSWEMEYRAKLTELSKANETIYKLMNSFIRGSKDDSTLSHPYAEFLVITNLSKAIFNENFVDEPERWKTISIEDINHTAADALKKNSSQLSKK